MLILKLWMLSRSYVFKVGVQNFSATIKPIDFRLSTYFQYNVQIPSYWGIISQIFSNLLHENLIFLVWKTHLPLCINDISLIFNCLRYTCVKGICEAFEANGFREIWHADFEDMISRRTHLKFHWSLKLLSFNNSFTCSINMPRFKSLYIAEFFQKTFLNIAYFLGLPKIKGFSTML